MTETAQPSTEPSTAPLTTLDAARTAELLVDGCVVRWWQTTAFVRVAGPDASSLLDGLCTQAVERIEPGTSRLGLFLDAKAKIIAPAQLHRLADAAWTDPKSGTADEVPAPSWALETTADRAEALRSHLAKYKLRARATVAVRADDATIALCGARLPELAELPADGGEWTVALDAAPPSCTWIGVGDAARELTQQLLPDRGFALADPESVEAARIDAGVAGLHDLLPDRMPAEVGGMEVAVALDAGCYLGQEPVARLHYRGRANRTLRRFVADGPIALASPGDDAVDDPLALVRTDAEPGARPVGRLTTWASRPDGSTTGFVVLRKEIEAGDELRLDGTDTTVRVSDSSPQADADA